MHKITPEQFSNIMSLIKELWPKDNKLNPLSDLGWDLYYSALDDLTYAQANEGLKNYAKSRFCKDRPLPGNIIDHCKPVNGEISAKDAALIVWSSVNRDVCAGSTRRAPKTKDKIALRVIESMGGFYELSQRQNDETPFLRRDFVAAYEAYARVEAIEQRCAIDNQPNAKLNQVRGLDHEL